MNKSTTVMPHGQKINTAYRRINMRRDKCKKRQTLKNSKWNSPSIDELPDYWFNMFINSYKKLTSCYNAVTMEAQSIPK